MCINELPSTKSAVKDVACDERVNNGEGPLHRKLGIFCGNSVILLPLRLGQGRFPSLSLQGRGITQWRSGTVGRSARPSTFDSLGEQEIGLLRIWPSGRVSKTV